jgi:hypothetical protein
VRIRSISSTGTVALVVATVLTLVLPPTAAVDDPGPRVGLATVRQVLEPRDSGGGRGDEASGSVTLDVQNNAVTASARGFPPHGTLQFEAALAEARGQVEVPADASGAAVVRFQLPPTLRGTLTVTVRSDAGVATASIGFPGPAGAGPASAGRVGVPISPAGFLGQFNLSSPSYAIANRFVVPQDVTIDRWYFAVNGEGADCVNGRSGYGSGDGGVHYGRIDATTGATNQEVLASERVNGCTAHERAQREFGLDETHQVSYVDLAPLTLRTGVMYAFVLSNVDQDPGSGGSASRGNHMSPNLNFADLADMGPNGRNTLDPNAASAVYGLDPRETTMWSEDAGRTWRFGDEVGWYDNGDGSGRMWPGGYRVAGGPNVAHGWIYMNWPSEDSASVSFTATDDAVLTRAGGASRKEAVGVITVENLDTGVSATTARLGTGLTDTRLSRDVPVAKGQRYRVSTSGRVDRGSAGFWDRVFPLGESGSLPYSCASCSNPNDRPMVYAATEES